MSTPEDRNLSSNDVHRRHRELKAAMRALPSYQDASSGGIADSEILLLKINSMLDMLTKIRRDSSGLNRLASVRDRLIAAQGADPVRETELSFVSREFSEVLVAFPLLRAAYFIATDEFGASVTRKQIQRLQATAQAHGLTERERIVLESLRLELSDYEMRSTRAREELRMARG